MSTPRLNKELKMLTDLRISILDVITTTRSQHYIVEPELLKMYDKVNRDLSRLKNIIYLTNRNNTEMF